MLARLLLLEFTVNPRRLEHLNYSPFSSTLQVVGLAVVSGRVAAP